MIAGSNPVQMPVLKPVANQNPSEDYVTEYVFYVFSISKANINADSVSNAILLHILVVQM